MGQLDRFKLDGQVALVGGGGGAIGSAMAVALAEAGARVAVTDISQELVDATKAKVEAVGGECMGNRQANPAGRTGEQGRAVRF